MSAIPAASVSLKTLADSDLYSRIQARSKPNDNGCWIWHGAKSQNGYGAIQVNSPRRAKMGTHRAIMQAVYGPLPTSVYVCHRCDVKDCVNPEHLFLGSAKDNAMDREAKGRGADFSGDMNPASKATSTQIAKALEKLSSGERVKNIAESMGVSKATVQSWMRKNGIRLGTAGFRNGRARLKPDDLQIIKSLLADGLSRVKIGKRLGVSDVAIGNMLRGKTWQ